MSFEFTALILRQSADGIAGLATARLFERFPDDLADDFTDWKALFRNQVLQLAVALQTQNPHGFAEHLAWAQGRARARSVPDAVILASLECLGEVARESVPSEMLGELDRSLRMAQERLQQAEGPSASLVAGEGPTQALAKAFLDALKHGEEQQATDLILGAHTHQNMPADVLIDGVLTPALREVGRLWHLGHMTIAEEHLITQTARKALDQLLASAPHQPPTGKTALLSSVAEEVHSFGIQAVAAHLQLAGWRTICLGADTPVDELVGAAQMFAADVVLLGVTVDLQIPNLIDTIRQVRRDLPSKKVLVGGAAFARNPELAQWIGADGQAQDGKHAVQLANELTA